MDSKELEKINRFTRREITEDELYTFSVILCDNEVDRDMERFSDAALEVMKETFLGKTGIFDHDTKGRNQSARIYDTQVVSVPERVTSYGAPFKQLKASAYMIRTEGNRDLIAEIDGGIKKEVSVSCAAERKICSICGDTQGKCGHQKGETYDGVVCHMILDGITDAYEWSFVAVPAQRGAGVTKRYKGNKKGGKTMEQEFVPIQTQEAFETAVSERVAAAVQQTEKRFEGWVSPEAAAALTKERDDSRNVCLKMKIAAEKGIPLELAEKLSGDTEESIRADADSLAKYVVHEKCYAPSPRFTGEQTPSDPMAQAYQELITALNNN